MEIISTNVSRRVLFGCFLVGTLALVGTVAAQAPSAPEPVPSIWIRMALNSLEPQSTTVTEGTYFLRFTQGILVGDVPVQLLDPQGKVALQAKIPKGYGKLKQTVQLSPGKYLFQVPGRAQWICVINVTKR